jgi:hypothetical protein
VIRNQNKRHHYVPIAYLSKFSDKHGRVYGYRKDEPVIPLHVIPDEIAFERYYFATIARRRSGQQHAHHDEPGRLRVAGISPHDVNIRGPLLPLLPTFAASFAHLVCARQLKAGAPGGTLNDRTVERKRPVSRRLERFSAGLGATRTDCVRQS